MRETVREVILDAQRSPLFTGVPRRLAVEAIPKKATVCIGVRRGGKSTYMSQIMQNLLDSGVPRENLLALNFFDDRLYDLRHGDIGVISDAYFSEYPQKKGEETVHCFFDEIQVLPRWESFVERMMRTEKCQIYITGSSAQMLSKEIATQMRGRSLSWEIFPFSFTEFLDAEKIASESPFTSKQRLLVEKHFEKFWDTGGFPEVTDTNPPLRMRVHQEYFNTILFRDIVERHDIGHPRAVSDLAHRLINNVGTLYTISALEGYVKSIGHRISRATIADFVSWFEDSFLFFSVGIFDSSLARIHTNPKRIYCVDHAMATSVGSQVMKNTGHLLENLVFVSLRRLAPRIHYFKSKNGTEVDFLVQFPNRSRMLVQVSETLSHPDTHHREVRAMREAMSELDLDTGVIVTRRHEDKQIKVPEGEIRVVPAWKFLLELPDTPPY